MMVGCCIALPGAAGAAVNRPLAASLVAADLSAVANVYGIAANGTAPVGGGLDTHGYALSANLVGAAITWSGVTFAIGGPGSPDAVSGATIPLSGGSFGALYVLALGTNGSQPNQTFLVNYTDGTTSTYTQSISDWWAPQHYPGEATALGMAYCVTPAGGQCPGPQAVYGYAFALNGAKSVKSLTLPGNRNVVVLAAALGNPASSPSGISLGTAANVVALFPDGTAPTQGGLIGSGYAISSTLAGTSLTWSGMTFNLGSPGVADASSSATIALPAGNYTAVKLLAVGARGNQVNQPFVVTYTDGTTTTVLQSLSDWWNPQNNPGETIALKMAYCVTPSGGRCPGATALYGYSLPINAAKTVSRLTLPNNRDVVVLAVGLSAAAASSSALSFAAADVSASQSAQSASVQVMRTGGASGAVTVQYATSDGSGVAGSLYTATQGTLQWAANDMTARSVSIPLSNANPFTGNESFHVSLSNPGGGAALGSPAGVTVTVTGAAASTSLQLAAASFTVAENAGSVTIPVTRSGSASGSVSVSYATAGGTAVPGTNYSSTSGTLTWAANDSSSKTITVVVDNAANMTANASFTVNLSAPGGGAALGPTSTATITVTPTVGVVGGGKAAQILSYLGGLDTGSSRRVLSGQHADIWNSDPASSTQPMDVVTSLAAQTGDNPAILALVLNYATNSGAYDVNVTDTLANQWWSKGGMVMLSLYDNDPTFSFNSTGAPIGQPIPAGAFHSLTDKTSAAYSQWHSQLDTYAAALHTLTDSGNVVLFRPFIEINGNWNWYGAESPADFIAIWQDMHDYLTVTKGVKNLLWIYNVNQDVGNYSSYYPGPAYVDIVGMDIYNPNPTSDSANATMYSQLVATGKPLILPEVGLGYAGPAEDTQDNRVIINAIRSAYPNVVGFVAFNGSFAICNQNNASALMNDPWVIDLAAIPASVLQ